MAAQSHTGAYGGTYAVYRGAFKQSGILAVDSFEALFAASKALSMQPPAAGPKISMIGNGAGPMVNAIDLFDPYALEIAVLEPESVKTMEAHFPAFYISKNPVDVTGSATSDDYRFAMETLLEDPGVDVIMNWFVLQDTPLDEGIVDVLDRINKKSQKPILCGATGGPFLPQAARPMPRSARAASVKARRFISGSPSPAGSGRPPARASPRPGPCRPRPRGPGGRPPP